MVSAGVQVEKVVLVGERIWLDPNGAQVLPLPDAVFVSLCLLTRRDLPTGPVSTFSSQRGEVASRLPVQRVEVPHGVLQRVEVEPGRTQLRFPLWCQEYPTRGWPSVRIPAFLFGDVFACFGIPLVPLRRSKGLCPLFSPFSSAATGINGCPRFAASESRTSSNAAAHVINGPKDA
jgi:hypothetical protein